MPIITLISQTIAHFEVPEGLSLTELNEQMEILACPEDLQAHVDAMVEITRTDIGYAYGDRGKVKTTVTQSTHTLYEGYKEP